MTSAHLPLLRFAITSDAAVRITVYGATGSKLGVGYGTVVLSLVRGLYRVHLERCGIVRELLVEHEQGTTLSDPGPPLQTPAPLAGAATSHDYYREAARKLSVSDTCRPLGDRPRSGRLFIFIRRLERKVGPPHVPSEPVTIHDLAGRKLAILSRDTARSDDDLGYISFSAQVAPGTYRIRAAHSRREMAITIPEKRAAHVFIADSGAVRVDDLRVALTHRDQPFDPEGRVALAMESLLAALKAPEPVFPPDARLLLPEAAVQDLCFGIASAHQLWRCQDKSDFDRVVQRLMPYVNVPDIAILAQLQQEPSFAMLHDTLPEPRDTDPTRIPDLGPPPQRGQLPLEAPPLMRASLAIATTGPELELSTVSPDSVFARAARTGFHDSIWCTWGTLAWDERWIEPTVETLRSRDNIPPASLARLIGLPPRTVERAINELDSKLPLVNGSPARAVDLRIPGYAIGEILGRGAQGKVFRATRVMDGQPVALKIIPLAGGRDQRERIEQDLDRTQGLSHPGLLGYSHWGALPNDTGLWFDMELCRGSVLDLLSAADAPLPFDRTCQIVLDALGVLEYLHGEGVVHGNLKPSNLLVRTDGGVVVADYGDNRGLLHDVQLIVTDRTAGAMRFFPHERLTDFKRSTPASDVWAMAATLYFLLTLDFPRDEYADQSEVEAALANPVVPIAERWAEVPGELARCIDRALSDDIHVRPKDAAQLRKDMTATLAMYNSPLPDHLQLPKGATEARKVPPSAPAELSSDSLLPVRPLGSSLRHPERSAHDRSGSWGARASIEHPAKADLPIAPRPGEPTVVEAWKAVWAEELADEVDDRVDRHRAIANRYHAIADRYRAIAHLRVLTGRVPQSVHVFQSSGTSIGRIGGDCDFLIDDERMSRRHARIERGATGWRLQDLMSRNGSFVDGVRVSAGETMNLAEGSVIRLGNTLMVFRTSAPTSDGRADSPVFPGISPMVVAVRRRIDALASGAGHVLILGEPGTGKARVAKAIGERRAPHPFVTLNSAELSRDLARSELFGHVRGAFTHATSNWPGLVDMAGDGVLFLDEIGELSLDVQAELLRFLEDGSYRPLGSTKLRHSNARVVAATHVDLDQAVQNNRFRRDLLARLRASNAPLKLPPLRERREDILGWTQLFLRQGNHDAGPTPWTVGALECLLLYPWAKNLRGLGSIVVDAASRSQTFPCGTEHLAVELRQHRETLARGTPDQLPVQSEPTEAEIQEALRDAQGHVRTAAEQLGIDRRKLYRLCERFGIAIETYRTDLPPKDE